ncbi:CBN-FRM-8 protein [Aphelenchoides besseyi]|nr:CBN-FRM-8 protein [Aphelenchoides besseyi]
MRTNESVRDDHTTSESLLNRRQPDRIALGLTVDAYHNASCEHVLHECDRCLLTDQRVFYLHRTARRSYWYPPYVAWHCTLGLPYGYELAIDEFGTQYYIHHIHQTTSYKDPRCSSSLEAIENATTSTFQNDNKIINPPVRSYEIHRNPKTGYGFVAANEKPVIIQFVTPCSSSDGRLLPRDQILAVNGVDVRCESKLKVIEMIRRSSSTLRLEVSQPSRLKENGIKNHGVRKVRFTERIAVAGSPVEYGSLLSVAKVLRVYLENGQTRSFSYDSNTTVQNILDNLTEKLHVRLCAHFALAVEQSISLAPARLSLLLNTRRIESLAISPLSSRLRCRLRIAFPPVDLVAYSVNDPSGFDYFYQQCVNDFVDGRLVEMRYEASLRLAALHIRQVCMENSVLKRLPPIRRIE